MNDGMTRRVIWVCAVVALAAGVGLTIVTLAGMRGDRNRIDRKVRDVERLREFQMSFKRCQTARKMFEQLKANHAASLDGLAAEALEGHKPEDTREGRRDLVPGWVARTIMRRDSGW